MKKEETIKKLKAQVKKNTDKSGKKTENDTSIMQTNNDQAKTNTSLINISLVSQSVSMSKFNPGRSFLQEVKTNRDNSAPRASNPLQRSQSNASKDFKLRNLGKESYREKSFFNEDEDDARDITSENILLGLNSPRIPNNGANTYRNHSSNKKDTEITLNTHRESRKHTIATIESKKGSKPVLGIDLCEACACAQENENTSDNNTCYSYRESNKNISDNTSFEIKRRTSGMHENSLRFNNNNNPTANERNSAVYASIDLGKAVSGMKNVTNASGRLSEFGTDEKKGMNLNLNLNRSVCNLPKGPQDISMSASYVGLQQSRSEFLNQGRGLRNDDDEDIQFSILKDRLIEAEQKTEKANLEREKLQVELDRLVLELKQTKMGWALSEEGKEESELALKNEIKFLINKLLQVKGTTASQQDLSQMNKSQLNKSTMDQHSSFINHSESLNISQFNPLTNNFVSSSSHQFEQNNFLALQSHVGDRKVNDSMEKKGMKRIPKVPFDGYSKTPLQDRCLNAEEFEITEESSSGRVSEFKDNENSLVLNLLTTNSNPKKLIKNIK